MKLREVAALAASIQENIGKVIVGKEETVERVVTAFLAGGHILLEDVPGTGKTKMARALAASVDMTFRRAQFTPDLLPSDLTGIHFYNQEEGQFTFRPGPVFTNILLADEINRATPRTQSSLLECMEERQVTIDGETMVPGTPFFVIATQNPIETQGTFPLPEAQIDRFIMQVAMGYPTLQEGQAILRRFVQSDPLTQLEPICTGTDVLAASEVCRTVFLHDTILQYLLEIVAETRDHEAIALGVSPRGSIAMMRCAQVLAAIHGRVFVTPDDIRSLVVPVFAHRIIPSGSARRSSTSIPALLEEILDRVPVPVEDWERVEA